MRSISCDLCRKDLTGTTDGWYSLAVETRFVTDPTGGWSGDAEPDTDHIDAMDELLAGQSADDDTTDEGDELPSPVAPLNATFDLCGKCCGKFAADPLGRALGRRFSFSQN